MSDLAVLQLGIGSLALWLASLVALWFLIDRKSRPGPVRSVLVIEAMMLGSIALLLIGIGMSLKGSGILD